jgi:hypothetical protein
LPTAVFFRGVTHLLLRNFGISFYFCHARRRTEKLSLGPPD